jgi:hypothetical protein
MARLKTTGKASVVSFLILLAAPGGYAQAGAQDPASQQQSEQQQALEKKALLLVDQVSAEVLQLRLPENRIEIQISIGDLLWDRDAARARIAFAQAAAAIVEASQSLGETVPRVSAAQAAGPLRRRLLTTVARRDPNLAYELLITTRPQQLATGAGGRGQESEAALEIEILAQIAARDPKLALKNAEAALDKGEYSRNLARVVRQLQMADKDAARGLAEKIARRLTADTLLANRDAGNLAMELLRLGPIPFGTAQPSPAQTPAGAAPALDDTSYRTLLESLISAALTAAPRTSDRQGGSGQPRAGNSSARRQPGGPAVRQQPTVQDHQQNARFLLVGLQSILPHVEKYAPLRAVMVKQRLNDLGIRTEQRQLFSQFAEVLQRGTVDALIEAAPNAPPGFQDRLYQQAAMKAVSEGDADRARQIAETYLDQGQRERVIQEIERQRQVQSALAGKVGDIQQTLYQMRSDRERVSFLVQVASNAGRKGDRKLALQLLQEARNLVYRRPENYQQLELQLAVAGAYAELEEPAAFEILEGGIDLLNELASAAAMLNGFEVRIFREGEIPVQGGSSLSTMISRFGRELGSLARIDFERAQAAAYRFQRPESRVLANLSIARGILAPGAASAPAPTVILRDGFPSRRR